MAGEQSQLSRIQKAMATFGFVRTGVDYAVPHDLCELILKFIDETSRFVLAGNYLNKFLVGEHIRGHRMDLQNNSNIKLQVGIGADVGGNVMLAIIPDYDLPKFQEGLRLQMGVVLKAMESKNANVAFSLWSSTILLDDVKHAIFDRLHFEVCPKINWMQTKNGRIARIDQEPCSLRKIWTLDGRIDGALLKSLKIGQRYLIEKEELNNWSFQVHIDDDNLPVLSCILLRFPGGVKSIKWYLILQSTTDPRQKQSSQTIEFDNHLPCIKETLCPNTDYAEQIDFTITATIAEVISTDNNAVDLSQCDVVSDLL